jgi:hypothetical protein
MASELARAGLVEREGFRFVRNAIWLRAVDLAQILGVSPNTVTRWEVGIRTLDQEAAAFVAKLVLDAVGEKKEYNETIHATEDQKNIPKSTGAKVQTSSTSVPTGER